MRKERVEVVQQVAVTVSLVSRDGCATVDCRIPICYTSGCQDEHSLAVLWFRIAVLSRVRCAVWLGLRHGFVDCRHCVCATTVQDDFKFKSGIVTFSKAQSQNLALAGGAAG